MEVPIADMPLADFSPHDWLETRRVLANTELLVNCLPLMRQEEILGVVTTMQDIGIFDDIVKQLSGYRALHDEMEAVLEPFGDAFVALDAQGRVLRVNTAYERLVAMGRGALVGRNINQLKRDPARISPLVRAVLEQQKRVVSHVRQPDGSDCMVTASPAFNDSGEISGDRTGQHAHTAQSRTHWTGISRSPCRYSDGAHSRIQRQRNFLAIARFAKGIPNVHHHELLPCNSYCGEKYAQMGLPVPYALSGELDMPVLRERAAAGEAIGLRVDILS